MSFKLRRRIKKHDSQSKIITITSISSKIQTQMMARAEQLHVQCENLLIKTVIWLKNIHDKDQKPGQAF